MKDKENVFIFPPCGEQPLAPEGFNPGVAIATKRGANKASLFGPLLPRLTAVLPPQGRQMCNGFTLIELLVVVLIIGILVAVAVPQYQKAVEKSRASQAITLLKTVFESAEAYYLANGTWPTSFEQLDIDIPWSGHTRYATINAIRDTLSNEDWSIQLYKHPYGPDDWGVLVGKLTGPYRGSGFSMFYQYSTTTSMKTRQLLCNELYNSDGGILFGKAGGEYCKKLFNASHIYTGLYLHYFRMP